MIFLDILKSPFKYSKDDENLDIKDSIINLAISLGVIVITLSLTMFILIKQGASLSLKSLGGGFKLGSIGNKFYGEIFDKIAGKLTGTILYSSLLGLLIGLALLVGVIFAIRKVSNSNYQVIQSLSLVSKALILPSVIMPVMILGALLVSSIGKYIIAVTLFSSFIIFIINIYEEIKVTNELGDGKIIYYVSLSSVLYYGVSIYITMKIFASGVSKAMFSF